MWRSDTNSLYFIETNDLDRTVTIPEKLLVNNSKNQLLDAHELLVMHKRFEENGFRRVFGRGLADLKPCCRSLKTDNSGKKLSSTDVNVSGNFNKTFQTIQEDKLHVRKTKYYNDNGYLYQLMPKKKISRQPGNENSTGLLDLRKSSNHISNCHSTSLRLPKFTSLPPENKEIFYTPLSCTSALPRLPEIKTRTKQTTVRKVTRKPQIKYGSNELGESCLHVRALLRNDNELSAITAVNSANIERTEPTICFPRVKGIFAMEKTSKKKGECETNLLYLYPTENHAKFKRFGLSSRGHGTGSVTMKDLTQTAPQQTARAIMVDNGAESLPAKINNDKLKDKRNVHFSEFLHEVHLYSPYTASEKSV